MSKWANRANGRRKHCTFSTIAPTWILGVPCWLLDIEFIPNSSYLSAIRLWTLLRQGFVGQAVESGQ